MPTVPIHTIRPLLDLVDFAELAEYVRERARSPPLCGTPSGPTTRAPSADHSPERGCAVLPSSPPLPQLSLPTAASASGPASHPTSPPRSDAPPPPSTPGESAALSPCPLPDARQTPPTRSPRPWPALATHADPRHAPPQAPARAPRRTPLAHGRPRARPLRPPPPRHDAG
ncbi:unnamed protein product [Cutaneotrichosporon oleaginosum]